MFYSYEILTQRKYGVATVWLVATLGSKYGGPKLQRKDIMSVNVPKACDTVINPEAPLALRLQSSLLYGITKCYSQQWAYLFQDAKLVHANVRKMYATTMNSMTLDLGMMRKSRGSEHNVLQDDPAFSPGINLLELGDLLSLGESLEKEFGNESLLTITDSFTDTHMPPSLNSGTRHRYQVITEPMNNSPSTDPGDMDLRMAGLSGEGKLEVPDYEFTADGSVKDIMPAAGGEPVSPKVDVGGERRVLGPRWGRERLESDPIVIAQVQRDHAEVLNQPAEYGTSNDVFSNPEQGEYDQDGDVLMHSLDRDLHETGNITKFGQGQDLEAEQIADIDTAPQRSRRPTRNRQVDSTIELRSADLASWRDNYIYNMEDQTERRQMGRQGYYARLYAKKIVLEWGIGGELRNPKLHALFSGSVLMQTFAKGKKREREGHDKNEGRRVRNREKYSEHNLGTEDKQNNDDGIEVARNAEASYNMGDEFHTPMPWNKSLAQLSQAGSVFGLPGQSSLLSSGGMRYATPLPLMSGSFEPASFTSHGGRVSASPLARRHRQSDNILEKIDLELGAEEEDEEKYLGRIQQGYNDYISDNINIFEHFGFGAEVDTQKVDGSQWLNEMMEEESYNFFEFVKLTINNRMAAEGYLAEFVTLDQLIIPNANRVIVAAQALQHVLLLATRGFIQVKQERPYGDIYIRLSEKSQLS